MNSQYPEIVDEYIQALGAPICGCGDDAPLRTSWTPDNLGRRFYRCSHCGKVDALKKEKRERIMKEGKKKAGAAFGCCVALLAVAIPMLTSLLGMDKKD